MIKNEKLQAGNECLLERDFNKARSLFEEVLKDDQDNVCAVRGKMFCDLKISEIKEIKTKSIVEGKRVPYSRYAKSVPESYSGYFTKVKEYFELAEANKHIAELIVDNERKNNNDATMIAESSAKEAKRNLFAIHYVESHKRRITRPKIICLPDIVGLIAFVIFVPSPETPPRLTRSPAGGGSPPRHRSDAASSSGSKCPSDTSNFWRIES